MKITFSILFFSILFIASSLAAPGTPFEKELEALINTAKDGFVSIKGHRTDEFKSDHKTYKSKLPLQGFNGYILVSEEGRSMFVATSNARSANLDVAMTVMLPPRGFEVHKDSRYDKDVTSPEGTNRMAYYKSEKKDATLTILFMKDSTYTITLTKYKEPMQP